MRRTDINRSAEMEVFVHVVERGGFSAAARMLEMMPSTVSKLIARLERRLGARLINRSTRQFVLTPEGVQFYERSRAILADMDDAERGAAIAVEATGLLRVNTSASYGTHVLSHILPDFLRRYPAITLDIAYTDNVVDILQERADVAVRAGPLQSSSLVARKLGDTAMVIVGSPDYLRRFSTPSHPSQLDQHNCLGLGYQRGMRGWPFRLENEIVSVVPAERVQASDGEGLRQLVVNGSGLARFAGFTVRDDIASGCLVPVLEDFNPGDREAFHAVHVGKGGPLPSRVRAFLDFLAEQGRVS